MYLYSNINITVRMFSWNRKKVVTQFFKANLLEIIRTLPGRLLWGLATKTARGTPPSFWLAEGDKLYETYRETKKTLQMFFLKPVGLKTSSLSMWLNPQSLFLVLQAANTPDLLCFRHPFFAEEDPLHHQYQKTKQQNISTTQEEKKKQSFVWIGVKAWDGVLP